LATLPKKLKILYQMIAFMKNKACHLEENSRFYLKPKEDRLKICLKCFFKRKFQKVATLAIYPHYPN
jgi:hypothetical protein